MSGKENILDNLSSAKRYIRYAEVILHGSGLIHLDDLEACIKKAGECLKATGLGDRSYKGGKL